MARRLARAAEAPITSALLIVNVLIWLGQISPFGYFFTNQFFFAPVLAIVEPWRMLTAGFVHDWSGPMHILFNSYAIWIFGRQLEPMLGALRFLFLHLTSIVGGSVAVLWLSNPQIPTVGASGALFGLMAAYFVVLRAVGQNSRGLMGLIAINLAFGFLMPGVSWQAHLGGLLAGGALTAVYAQGKSKRAQLVGAIAVALIFVALTWYRMQTMLLG